MKTLKITVAALAIAGFASTAQAQDSYVNVGVSSYDFDAYGLSAKVGHNFNEYFGIEGQGDIGIIDDEQTIGNIEVDVGLEYLVGGFGVVRFPAGENFDVFGRAGYYFAEVEGSSGGISESVSTDSFALGAGGQYSWDGLNGIRAEYTYLDGEGDDGGSLDTFTVSYVRKF